MSCILTSGLDILCIKWQLNVITTVLQGTFYRVTDLYTGVVTQVYIYTSLPRDLADVRFKARYNTIPRTFNGTVNFCAVSGFRVSCLATPDIILNFVLDRVCFRIDVTWLPWLAGSDGKW